MSGTQHSSYSRKTHPTATQVAKCAWGVSGGVHHFAFHYISGAFNFWTTTYKPLYGHYKICLSSKHSESNHTENTHFNSITLTLTIVTSTYKLNKANSGHRALTDLHTNLSMITTRLAYEQHIPVAIRPCSIVLTRLTESRSQT